MRDTNTISLVVGIALCTYDYQTYIHIQLLIAFILLYVGRIFENALPEIMLHENGPFACFFGSNYTLLINEHFILKSVFDVIQ